MTSSSVGPWASSTPTSSLLELFDRGDAIPECDVLVFDSKGIIDAEIISAEAGNAFIINPDIHEAVFVRLGDAGVEAAVRGTFGAGTPEATTSPASSEGKLVRCEADVDG